MWQGAQPACNACHCCVLLSTLPPESACHCSPTPAPALLSPAAVDALFNGEDILMNFVLANASQAAGRSAAVQFVRPTVRGQACGTA